MLKYKQLAPQLAENSVKVLKSIKARNIVARLKFLVSVQKNEKKFKGAVEKFLTKNFSVELAALSAAKNDVTKASLSIKKAKAIAKAVAAKKAAAKKVATKKTASKKVASKKVASKKVASKKVVAKKAVKKVAPKKAAKKVAKKAAPAKKVAAKKSK